MGVISPVLILLNMTSANTEAFHEDESDLSLNIIAIFCIGSCVETISHESTFFQLWFSGTHIYHNISRLTVHGDSKNMYLFILNLSQNNHSIRG